MSTPDIITRPEWGARYANGFGLRTIGDLDVYLHHSVTIAPDLLPPFTDDYADVRTLEDIGQSRFGRGISYHFPVTRSEEHTSELQSLMRNSYAVFCLKQKNNTHTSS